jgi:hypothetical protein
LKLGKLEKDRHLEIRAEAQRVGEGQRLEGWSCTEKKCNYVCWGQESLSSRVAGRVASRSKKNL